MEMLKVEVLLTGMDLRNRLVAFLVELWCQYPEQTPTFKNQHIQLITVVIL